MSNVRENLLLLQKISLGALCVTFFLVGAAVGILIGALVYPHCG